METSLKEYHDFEGEIEKYFSSVKEKLNEMQIRKKHTRQVYDAACSMLRVENKLSKHDKSNEEKK